ncbi:MAG: hypothetical protein ABFE08_12095 [Armatimonadia bacterium]
MSERALPLKLGLIPLALYLVLAAGAAIVVPSDYAGDPRPTPPDEGPHVGYVAHLATKWTLPVFRSLADNYEGHQPPLYYATALPAYFAARAVAPGEIGGLSRTGLVLLRLWSVLVGGIAVWALWLLGRLVFSWEYVAGGKAETGEPPVLRGGKGADAGAGETPALRGKGTADGGEAGDWRRLLALAPALLLALWPGRTMIVSAITNDGLAEGMCLVTLYLCLRALSRPVGYRDILWLGLAWSGALLSKSTSAALGPIVLLALVMGDGAYRRSNDAGEVSPELADRGRLLKNLALLAGIVVVLTGWWFVRNQMLYGDPLAARVFEELFSKDRATPEYFFKLGLSGGAYFTLVVMNTALSFWGVYGQANVYSPVWYYALGFGIWAVALVGLVGQKIADGKSAAPGPQTTGKGKSKGSKRQEPEGQGAAGGEQDWRRQAFVLCWVLLVVVVAFFLRFNTSFYQAQARYLFAASGAIWLLMTLGLWDVGRKRYGAWVVAAALAVMLVMSVWSVAGFGHLVAEHYPPPLFGG